MLGAWCNAGSYYQAMNDDDDDDDDAIHVYREKDVDACGNHGGFHMHKEGFDTYRFGPLASCRFTTIEFSRHSEPTDQDQITGRTRENLAEKAKAPLSDVYLVRATCTGRPSGFADPDDISTWDEGYEIQTSGDWMILRSLTEG